MKFSKKEKVIELTEKEKLEKEFKEALKECSNVGQELIWDYTQKEKVILEREIRIANNKVKLLGKKLKNFK